MQHLFTHLRTARFTPSALLALVNLSVNATCEPFKDKEHPANIKVCIARNYDIYFEIF